MSVIEAQLDSSPIMSLSILPVAKRRGRKRCKTPKDHVAHVRLQQDVPQILDRVFFTFRKTLRLLHLSSPLKRLASLASK